MSAAPKRRPAWLRPVAELVDRGHSEEPSRLAAPPEQEGRQSAVLILLAGTDEASCDVVLLQRGPTLRAHPGQPGFPGGSLEAGDDGPVAAALREAHEEIGLDPRSVSVLGALPPVFLPGVSRPGIPGSRSGFLVTPVLAHWREPHLVHPVDRIEVAAVCRVPIRELTDPRNRYLARHPNGTSGPAFAVRDMLVWGFTAGLLDRLLRLAGWEQEWDRSRWTDLPLSAALPLAAPSLPWAGPA